MALQAEDVEVDEIHDQSNLDVSGGGGGGGRCLDELGIVDDTNHQMLGGREHLGLAQEQIDEGIEVITGGFRGNRQGGRGH